MRNLRLSKNAIVSRIYRVPSDLGMENTAQFPKISLCLELFLFIFMRIFGQNGILPTMKNLY
jgi:hypothetical protein